MVIIWDVHFFSFFCDKKRKETEPKKRKKNATEHQGYRPEPHFFVNLLFCKN